MPRVRYAKAFVRDLRLQLGYLTRQGDGERILGLDADIAELERLLSQFPAAGRELARREDLTLRKLKLRRAPFVVWYSFDPGEGLVVFARLFHSRQDSPQPRLP